MTQTVLACFICIRARWTGYAISEVRLHLLILVLLPWVAGWAGYVFTFSGLLWWCECVWSDVQEQKLLMVRAVEHKIMFDPCVVLGQLFFRPCFIGNWFFWCWFFFPPSFCNESLYLQLFDWRALLLNYHRQTDSLRGIRNSAKSKVKRLFDRIEKQESRQSLGSPTGSEQVEESGIFSTGTTGTFTSGRRWEWWNPPCACTSQKLSVLSKKCPFGCSRERQCLGKLLIDGMEGGWVFSELIHVPFLWMSSLAGHTATSKEKVKIWMVYFVISCCIDTHDESSSGSFLIMICTL